jgi:pyruvate/2-oxoglutarate dehydrogenase complex dihydrolipoamide acyltransferase (E2) component
MQGTIVSLGVQEGDAVHAGKQLLIMEAMKMEHVIESELSGVVQHITVAEGDTVYEGHPLAFIEEGEVDVTAAQERHEIDLDYIRPDLAEVVERH